jgi:NTP pyrophosphatase (non-canonical NTP hydrolase)
MPPPPLTLQTYQISAAKTDRTRNSKPLEFLLLGLFGEIGTLMDEVKKKQRDSRSYVGYEGSVIEELGDVLWYLTNIADRPGLALSAIARHANREAIDAFTTVGPPLTFASLQPQAHLPLRSPTPAFERTLMRLVSAIGDLASCDITGSLSTPDVLGSRLSTIFGFLVDAANEAGVTLDQAASENLIKTFNRWPTRKEFPPLFDDDSPPEEQLPRTLEVEIYERVLNANKPNEKQYVLQRCNGVFIGDRVTDNIIEPDDYRFHDVFHYAYAAILGWSPVIRALFRLKRKADAKIDEGQDGARAILIEEGVSTFIFAYAKQLEFFEGQQAGEYQLYPPQES